MPRVSCADSHQGFNGSGETAVPAKAHILAMTQDWQPNLHVLQKYGQGHYGLAYSPHLGQECG